MPRAYRVNERGEKAMTKQQTQALKRWTRLVTAPLTRVRPVPRRLDSQAGAGFFLTVHGNAEGRGAEDHEDREGGAGEENAANAEANANTNAEANANTNANTNANANANANAHAHDRDSGTEHAPNPPDLLYLRIAPRDAGDPAAAHTRSASLAYVGKEQLSAAEQRWLKALRAGVRLAEQRPGWEEFLRWAYAQPAVGLPEALRPAERITSGHLLLVRLNTRCNARCAFCSSHGVLPDLVPDAAAAARRLREAREAGAAGVAFTGGEPTLEPALPELIAQARALGYPTIELQTNGMLFAPRKAESETRDESSAGPSEQSPGDRDPLVGAKGPRRNQLVSSRRRGAALARTEQRGDLSDSERRGTPPARMDRRPERSSFSCTGPKRPNPSRAPRRGLALLDRLVDAGLDQVLLSFHAADPAVNDQMFGLAGAHQRALAGLDALAETSVELTVNCVITRLNLSQVVPLIRLLGQRYPPRTISSMTLSVAAPLGWALEHQELLPPLDSLRPVLAEAVAAGKEAGIGVRVPGLCGVPMCLLPEHAEIFDEFHDTDPPQLPTRAYAAACQRCPVRARCSGYWKVVLERHGDQALGWPAGLDPGLPSPGEQAGSPTTDPAADGRVPARSPEVGAVDAKRPDP